MNVLVLTQQYPNKDDLYRNGFVHTRVKKYLEVNDDISIKVFVISKENKMSTYFYDGIEVVSGNGDLLIDYVMNQKIESMFIHFLLESMVKPLLDTRIKNIPKRIWVHGYEALSWKRRLFNGIDKYFFYNIYKNEKQLKSFRNFVLSSINSKFIFVSEWMKNIAEEDMKVVFEDSVIIPNGIDTDYYFYEDKKLLKKNILLIRPFNSRKYATDIATEAILLLSKEDIFNDLKFTIVGEGKYLEKDIAKIQEFNNVKIIPKFVDKTEIRELHKKNGIFLCPTRQDAQGVSMCEAMSSGLVPITSNNTAIPEFVSEEEGYLCENANDLKNAILDLQAVENIKSKSFASRNRIIQKCELNNITIKELSLLNCEEF
ncbi:glycosyltransferase family 4 protein [Vagococcus fluvialis]|uniref:glycosyltransferase family 4 protein n=1 Tax=Vagococcus fluvialis TaxID=2738 RepID=UPI0020334327|nr:glycosyltransferase family 4 protein [Vagococcus fluvialis]MCM2138010.1 glycosyltransferase family 4 protein [Vagococcus fluvialis]